MCKEGFGGAAQAAWSGKRATHSGFGRNLPMSAFGGGADILHALDYFSPPPRIDVTQFVPPREIVSFA
jgi:hypothetical protein